MRRSLGGLLPAGTADKLFQLGLCPVSYTHLLGNWNEYYFASLITSSASNRTLPYALAFFNETFAFNYTRMFAALTIVIIPGILVYIVAQEQVQMSIASGSVKG